MAKPAPTLLLINRAARKGEADIEELKSRLSKLGRVVSPHVENKPDMQQLIRKYGKAVERIVIGGGDGTLHAALPSLIEADLPLGVLPLGTANDFARSLGISSVADAVTAILSGRTRRVDVGVVNDHPFLNAAGIGLGPSINRDMDRSSKRVLGSLSYFVHFIREMRNNRVMRASIRFDGKKVNVKSLQITIGNGIHYGGGMTLAKDAKIDDGLLDVLSIRPQSLASLLMRGIPLRSGDLQGSDYVQVFRGRSVSVTTGRVMEVTADGEAATHTPVHCHVLEKILSVFVPRYPELS